MNMYKTYLIHFAAMFGNLPATKYLLGRGTDVNSLDGSKHVAGIFVSRTPSLLSTVGFAAAGNFPECVRYLLSQGAEVNIADIHGHGPLYAAAVRGHLEIVKMLVEAGADPTQKETDTGFSLVKLLEQSKQYHVAEYLRALTTA
jgi:ankyrin repeat protein